MNFSVPLCVDGPGLPCLPRIRLLEAFSDTPRQGMANQVWSTRRSSTNGSKSGKEPSTGLSLLISTTSSSKTARKVIRASSPSFGVGPMFSARSTPIFGHSAGLRTLALIHQEALTQGQEQGWACNLGKKSSPVTRLSDSWAVAVLGKYGKPAPPRVNQSP